MATAKTKDTRSRNFATVVYPDSAPENWLSLASELCVPAFISPLHDNDVNPTGEIKKPHWHIMFMFEGKKSLDQVQELFLSFGGVGIEKVNSIRSYARYLCHLDNPDKAQYKCEDVISIAGADYFAIIGLASDKYIAVGEIMRFCMENDIYSFSELSLYSMVHRQDWFRVLVDKSTVYIKEFLKSRSWDTHGSTLPRRVNDEGDLIVYDPDTGEVL